MTDPTRRLLARALVTTLFVGVGVAHFVAADRFLAIMPPYLPIPRTLNLLAGVFEVLGGVGVWAPWPKLRKAAGHGLIALLVAVYIVNIDMALHGPVLRDGTPVPGGALALWLRLPMQFVFMWLVVYATQDRDAEPAVSA